ncbi:hypothetical protein CPB85DRAFT_1264236 [Mucidula mucida]|nr:hypothetical protein CPB85DRAFT_1264236 [Mucidula mucida]
MDPSKQNKGALSFGTSYKSELTCDDSFRVLRSTAQTLETRNIAVFGIANSRFDMFLELKDIQESSPQTRRKNSSRQFVQNRLQIRRKGEPTTQFTFEVLSEPVLHVRVVIKRRRAKRYPSSERTAKRYTVHSLIQSLQAVDTGKQRQRTPNFPNTNGALFIQLTWVFDSSNSFNDNFHDFDLNNCRLMSDPSSCDFEFDLFCTSASSSPDGRFIQEKDRISLIFGVNSVSVSFSWRYTALVDGLTTKQRLLRHWNAATILTAIGALAEQASTLPKGSFGISSASRPLRHTRRHLPTALLQVFCSGDSTILASRACSGLAGPAFFLEKFFSAFLLSLGSAATTWVIHGETAPLIAIWILHISEVLSHLDIRTATFNRRSESQACNDGEFIADMLVSVY